MLKYFGLPEDTQTWTRFDKRAKTYRTTSSSGPSWRKVIARIAIHDETGHVISLEYSKHMTENDVHRNLPSVRDIRTVLLPVTPKQQLKQSFHAFAALPVDETTQRVFQPSQSRSVRRPRELRLKLWCTETACSGWGKCEFGVIIVIL